MVVAEGGGNQGQGGNEMTPDLGLEGVGNGVCGGGVGVGVCLCI